MEEVSNAIPFTLKDFNIDLNDRNANMLIITWALINDDITGPNILNIIAGITQYIKPMGNPKSW
mgnify:CR=1 FL=1